MSQWCHPLLLSLTSLLTKAFSYESHQSVLLENAAIITCTPDCVPEWKEALQIICFKYSSSFVMSCTCSFCPKTKWLEHKYFGRIIFQTYEWIQRHINSKNSFMLSTWPQNLIGRWIKSDVLMQGTSWSANSIRKTSHSLSCSFLCWGINAVSHSRGRDLHLDIVHLALSASQTRGWWTHSLLPLSCALW